MWNQEMGCYFHDLKIKNQFVLVTSASTSHCFAKNRVREEIKKQFEEKNGKKKAGKGKLAKSFHIINIKKKLTYCLAANYMCTSILSHFPTHESI